MQWSCCIVNIRKLVGATWASLAQLQPLSTRHPLVCKTQWTRSREITYFQSSFDKINFIFCLWLFTGFVYTKTIGGFRVAFRLCFKEYEAFHMEISFIRMQNFGSFTFEQNDERLRTRTRFETERQLGNRLLFTLVSVPGYPGTQRISRSRTSMGRRDWWWGKTWENLWVHTLGPLNVPIQSEAAIEVSESDFDSQTSQTASYWIGAFNVRPEVLSRFASSPVFAPRSFVSEKTPGFQGSTTPSDSYLTRAIVLLLWRNSGYNSSLDCQSHVLQPAGYSINGKEYKQWSFWTGIARGSYRDHVDYAECTGVLWIMTSKNFTETTVRDMSSELFIPRSKHVHLLTHTKCTTIFKRKSLLFITLVDF